MAFAFIAILGLIPVAFNFGPLFFLNPPPILGAGALVDIVPPPALAEFLVVRGVAVVGTCVICIGCMTTAKFRDLVGVEGRLDPLNS